MRFRSFDALRVFDVVARRLSFTAAADDLNLTKGAVGHRINRLEEDLGFAVFIRGNRGLVLTEKGQRLWHVSQAAFGDIERQIDTLREARSKAITIGLPTYFASRWLSPRLMRFMTMHPDIRLRLLPMIDLIDIRGDHLDMAIRWGSGAWSDLEIESLFACPAVPMANAETAETIGPRGLEHFDGALSLLHDREESRAWADWHATAGRSFQAVLDPLVIPDPNVRVQAVIDGQGIALNDRLAEPELTNGTLVQVSEISLTSYGYHLAYAKGALGNPALRAFRDWIKTEAMSETLGS